MFIPAILTKKCIAKITTADMNELINEINQSFLYLPWLMHELDNLDEKSIIILFKNSLRLGHKNLALLVFSEKSGFISNHIFQTPSGKPALIIALLSLKINDTEFTNYFIQTFMLNILDGINSYLKKLNKENEKIVSLIVNKLTEALDACQPEVKNKFTELLGWDLNYYYANAKQYHKQMRSVYKIFNMIDTGKFGDDFKSKLDQFKIKMTFFRTDVCWQIQRHTSGQDLDTYIETKKEEIAQIQKEFNALLSL